MSAKLHKILNQFNDNVKLPKVLYQDSVQFQLFIDYPKLQSCNIQWFQKVKELQYQKSHFGLTTSTGQIRIYDDNIRLSQFTRKPFPEFTQITSQYLSQWSGNSAEDFDTSPQWNSLRYVYGHFSWHQDKIRFKEGFDHYGTQIIFPPMQFGRFKKGELLIIDRNEKQLRFVPDENNWTYIIIPLGYKHCVQKVDGIRYSFTKQVFAKKGVELKNKINYEMEKINI